MLIDVGDATLQTYIFFIIFGLVLLATLKKTPETKGLSPLHTNELKGIAILMVIFAHTAFALSKDTKFLYPLSLFAGVGVNIFLFLSGFGLTASALKNRLTPYKFYLKRFTNILLPMWLVISLFYVMDFIFLHISRPRIEMLHSYLGYFPVADIHSSFNSPLWYFTFICFYYLIFPLLFSRRTPLLSIIAVYFVSVVALKLALPVSKDVLTLYKLHVLAFPLGMFFSIASQYLAGSNLSRSLSSLITKIRPLLLLGSMYAISYLAIHSGIGESLKKEQLISLLTVLIIVAAVLIKRFYFTTLSLLGDYSYEIYLIQWPLMYRFDFLYKNLPASVATALYLVIFLVIAKLIRVTIRTLVRPAQISF